MWTKCTCMCSTSSRPGTLIDNIIYPINLSINNITYL